MRLRPVIAGGRPASALLSLPIPKAQRSELVARQVIQLGGRPMDGPDALLLFAWLGSCLAVWAIRVMQSGFFGG